jgi:hypothetical protein
MSANYGVTIQLSGPKEDEERCLAELTASLRECFKDRGGQVCFTLPAIFGSNWAMSGRWRSSKSSTLPRARYWAAILKPRR